ncbi:MAG: LacI family transcriptional regulator [Firmicutes bacterium]|jgi:LacI family transcriptional regulator|nr:LacI family transcriptional regulator [Bacillota bacterium]
MATIREVARASGVSISTVSRVMNAPDRVSPEKRMRVERAIKELGYTPNALARGLISKQTDTVGVLMPDISNPYAAEVVKGIEDAGHALGIHVILCNTDSSAERTLRNLSVLRQKQVDGIIFMSKAITEEFYQAFQTMNVPIVLVATESLVYDIPSVKIDDEQASYDAVQYLARKGHVNIGMISGPIGDTIAGLPRYKGFRRACREILGIEDTASRVEFATFHFHSGYEAMSRLYEKQPRLTAVFCASDEIALGAMSLLHDLGIAVPDDISIVGFDNTKIARMSIPKLTTVAQPMYEMGKAGMEVLRRLREEEPLDQLRIYMKHVIVERESVKSLM